MSPHPGDRGVPTETTRYLCAAAYLDRRFADWVVDEVLESELRATAPSHGVDLTPVVRHCVRARQLYLVRDAVLTAVVLGGVVLLLLGTPWIVVAVRVLPLAWATVFAALCLTHYEIVTASMLRDRFDPGVAPRASLRRERALAMIADDARSNVTVYSGFSPFVGCGLDISGWSFVVDTRRGKEDLDGHRRRPTRFAVDELYHCVATRVADLRLDHLGMEGRLFVSGRELDGMPWLLSSRASRPLVVVDQQAVDHFRRTPSDRVRHYSVVKIVGWQGELVVSMFLRFSFTGDNLFCEASYFLLTPVAERYHEVDDLNTLADLRTAGGFLGRSLALALPLALVAPFLVLVHALAPWRRWRGRRIQRRLARQSPTYDHGTVTTVREWAMSRNYRHYFQKLDKQMYVKLVEQQILDAVITFLDARDIDTSELRERQTTILNNGVMVSGGSVSAQSLSVGAGSRARTTQAVRTAVGRK